MKRIVIVLLLLLCGTASAHIGSPDVFFEGDAGPYPLYVTVRSPDVIPGVATVEIRARSSDVTAITVVPLRLTGPGSELPPTPDRATRSTSDPQFFTASLWLMERGSLQVRIHVDGARGDGTLAVPIPASAQRTLGMNHTLGAALLALMLLLALSLVAIAGAAVREAALDPGSPVPARSRRRSRLAIGLASVLVTALIVFGHRWWQGDEADYERMISKPWLLEPRLDGCRLTLNAFDSNVLPDHGHDMHVFMVRAPTFDRLAHLHPTRSDTNGSEFVQTLPSLPAGRYHVFADIVWPSGFPTTGAGDLYIPRDLTCPPAVGDDATWSGAPSPDVVFDAPAAIRAREPLVLRFRIVNPDGSPATNVEPYMAMAGHAAIVADDLSVFAHIHPNGSVAMPALMLAKTPHTMYAEGHALPPEVSFPYGFPKAGRYHVFVQIKRAGVIETAAFPVEVLPPAI